MHIYHDDQDEAIDLGTLLATQPLGTHVYVCGPKGMIEWVHGTSEEMGWLKPNQPQSKWRENFFGTNR